MWFPDRLACGRCHSWNLSPEHVLGGVLTAVTESGDGEITIGMVEVVGGATEVAGSATLVGRVYGDLEVGCTVSIVTAPGIEGTVYVPAPPDAGRYAHPLRVRT